MTTTTTNDDLRASAPSFSCPSPWGNIDYVTYRWDTEERFAPGIALASTESHGGLWVPSCYLGKIHKPFLEFARNWDHGWHRINRAGQWFEEDCAVAIPLVFLPDEVPASPQARQRALQTIRAFMPDQWADYLRSAGGMSDPEVRRLNELLDQSPQQTGDSA